MSSPTAFRFGFHQSPPINYLHRSATSTSPLFWTNSSASPHSHFHPKNYVRHRAVTDGCRFLKWRRLIFPSFWFCVHTFFVALPLQHQARHHFSFHFNFQHRMVAIFYRIISCTYFATSFIFAYRHTLEPTFLASAHLVRFKHQQSRSRRSSAIFLGRLAFPFSSFRSHIWSSSISVWVAASSSSYIYRKRLLRLQVPLQKYNPRSTSFPPLRLSAPSTLDKVPQRTHCQASRERLIFSAFPQVNPFRPFSMHSQFNQDPACMHSLRQSNYNMNVSLTRSRLCFVSSIWLT